MFICEYAASAPSEVQKSAGIGLELTRNPNEDKLHQWWMDGWPINNPREEIAFYPGVDIKK